jgi:negative regulator of sigma-B (phosphoserine phosphatase)
MLNIDYHLLKRALTGLENECGDTGVIKVYENKCFFALIDVLGHGKDAYKDSVLAENYLLENYRSNLVDMMNGLHLHLKGTRGAVATLCRLDIINGEMNYVGIGNITGRVYGIKSSRFVSRDGVIGYNVRNPKEQQAKLYPGDILILSSDGVKEHFDLAFYPDLLKGSAQKIATGLIDHLGKGSDDSSCIVLRYGK